MVKNCTFSNVLGTPRLPPSYIHICISIPYCSSGLFSAVLSSPPHRVGASYGHCHSLCSTLHTHFKKVIPHSTDWYFAIAAKSKFFRLFVPNRNSRSRLSEMRLSGVLAASLVAPWVVAHSGVPGSPKIFGLAPNDVATLRSRNVYGGHAARHARFAHNSKLDARQGGQDGRCGKEFGCASCAAGYCCSSAGYCENSHVHETFASMCLLFTGGQGQDYCQAPDSQFEYGPGADANKLPSGGTTRNIARPKPGEVPYGGEGIYACNVPGQIAITYDDGPYIYTNDVLDLFAQYKFKATFCKFAT
jgi:hypothetical protein